LSLKEQIGIISNGCAGINIFADCLHISGAQQGDSLHVKSDKLGVIVLPAQVLQFLVRCDPVIIYELPNHGAVNRAHEARQPGWQILAGPRRMPRCDRPG